MPMLEVVTRTFRRPTMLAANKASVADQVGGSVKHTILVDQFGAGVPAANAGLATFEPVGDYVWILDDDDVCIYPHLAVDLARIADTHRNPPAVIVRMDHGSLGVLPHDGIWGVAVHEAGIGTSGIITRRDVWMQHRQAWASARYASDYDFIAAVWAACGPQIVWHDVVASRVQRISHGQPEAVTL